MGFDLYAVGGWSRASDQFLMDKGLNVLYSQKYYRSSISRWIENADEQPDKAGKLFVDSSAYGAWTRNAVIDIDDYIGFLNNNAGKFSVIASLDVIPGRKGEQSTRQQVKEASEQSWENYLYMYEQMIDKDELIPVFHVGEPLDALHRILEHRHPNGSPIKYMGLGGLVGVPKEFRLKWLDSVWDIIMSSSNPDIKTHAFGVTMLDILERYPFASADSGSAGRTGTVGFIMSPHGVINLSERFGGMAAFNKLPKEAKDLILSLMERTGVGMTIEELIASKDYRIMVNFQYLSDWVKTYRYKPRPQKQRRLF